MTAVLTCVVTRHGAASCTADRLVASDLADACLDSDFELRALLVREMSHGHVDRDRDPSPDEIRAACLEIQAEWSDDISASRARGLASQAALDLPEPMTVPVGRDCHHHRRG